MKRFVLLIMFSLLFSCTPEPIQTDFSRNYPPERGGKLIFSTSGEPSNLIAALAGDSESSLIAGYIFNGLLKYDGNLELTGDLAESWTVSPDQKTLTFKLRPNLKWSDGVPLTSQDILFTWQLMIDKKTQTPYSADYQLVQKAEALDERTFEVHYAQPYAPALDSWATLHILPRHKLMNTDINKTNFSHHPIGSNFYQLAEWKNGEYLTLTRNPTSYKPAYIDELNARIIPDRSTQLLELMAENLDEMSLNSVQYARIFPARPKLQRNFLTYKELGNNYVYLGFNLRKPPFNDVKVRQALNYAINKQEIIDGVLLGLGETIASPYKPGTRWSHPQLKPYEYNPQKARKLLQQAGWRDDNHDGILEKDGEEFQFEILTSQNKERETAATLIQKRLKEVGIDVKIRVLEWATLIGRFVKPQQFEAIILGWGLGIEPDQYHIWHSSQQKPGQFNFIGYENPHVDALLEAGRLSLDLKKRQKIYHEFAEILHNDNPIIYLFAGYNMNAIHKRVKGIDNPPALAGVSYNQEYWYIPVPLRRYEIQ